MLATSVFAQDRPSLAVAPDPGNGHRGVITLGDVLADDELENAVRSGLPLRIRFRVELWKDEFVDELLGAEQWTTVFTFDPLSELYIVRTRSTSATARAFPEYRSARDAIEAAYAVSLRPNDNGRFYYTAAVDIETLSLSDLDELERWLKGELQPAVSGDGSIPGALGQGARRLFMRVLSLPERRFEARSGRFRLP
jgi:hypothetical protein